ncbi:hypothetical protein ATKI12_5034 [Kitasatospora sp. Ki12]
MRPQGVFEGLEHVLGGPVRPRRHQGEMDGKHASVPADATTGVRLGGGEGHEAHGHAGRHGGDERGNPGTGVLGQVGTPGEMMVIRVARNGTGRTDPRPRCGGGPCRCAAVPVSTILLACGW